MLERMHILYSVGGGFGEVQHHMGTATVTAGLG